MAFTPFQCGDPRTTEQLLSDFFYQELGRDPECDNIPFSALEREWLYFKLGLDLVCEDSRTNNQLWMDFIIDDLSIDFQCNDSRTLENLQADWFYTKLAEDPLCTDSRTLNNLLMDYLYTNVS